MKRNILTIITSLGLCLSGWAANLVWTPTTANWDLATTNWKNTNTSAIVAFAQGDDVLFDDTGSAFTSVVISGSLTPGAVVVDSSLNYTFTTNTAVANSKLVNVSLLTKRGSGRLTLDTDNTITAPTVIEAGTLEIGAAGGRGDLGSGNITNYGTLSCNRTGTLNSSNNISGTGALAMASTSSGNWLLFGTNTMNNYSILQSNGIIRFVRSSLGTPQEAQLVAGPSRNARLQLSGGDINLNFPIKVTGATGDASARAAVQTWDGSNSCSGLITVGPGSGSSGNQPMVSLLTSGSQAALPSPTPQLTVLGNVVDQDPAHPFAGNLYIRGKWGIGNLYGTINLPYATIDKEDAGSTWIIYSTGNKAILTYVNSGTVMLAATDALPVAQLTVNGTVDLGGFDQHVGALWGLGSITNSSTTSDAVLSLTNGGNYEGKITDGASRKVGLTFQSTLVNAQQLRNICTYSGPTTIAGSGLTLINAGEIPNSTPISIGNGSAIDASEKADYTFTVQPAQTLKPNGISWIKGNLTLRGTVELKLNKSGHTLSSDRLALDPAFTWSGIDYGGTLALDLRGDPLGGGDSFSLFVGFNNGGSFTDIYPPTPGPGRSWNVSQLYSLGILSVDSTLPTTPTNIAATVISGGSVLKLEWPIGYTGWALQAQTNAAGTGLSTNWHYVAGSDSTNAVFLPIDRGNGSVFYRMVYP